MEVFRTFEDAESNYDHDVEELGDVVQRTLENREERLEPILGRLITLLGNKKVVTLNEIYKLFGDDYLVELREPDSEEMMVIEHDDD